VGSSAAAAAGAGEDSDDDLEGAEPLSDTQIGVRAAAGMAGGLAVCAAFSDPLVDSLSHLSQVRGLAPVLSRNQRDCVTWA